MELQDKPFESVYEVGSDLGSGHFAVVKQCRHHMTGTEYAAKMIRKKRTPASRRGASMENIMREVALLGEVDHENIVKLFEAFDKKNEVILVLELVSGGELFEYLIIKHKVSEDEAVVFLRQILSGVDHLHSKDIVHLDLKPENLMLKEKTSSQLKIIDFGLSRKLSKKEETKEIMGTAEFIAPEVVNYDPLSKATDMWSIGVITYILLSGCSPFLGDTDQETMNNIVSLDYSLEIDHFNKTSDLAKDFISNLLVMEPRYRFTVEQCMSHPWILPKDRLQKLSRRSSSIDVDNLRRFVEANKLKDRASGKADDDDALWQDLLSYDDEDLSSFTESSEALKLGGSLSFQPSTEGIEEVPMTSDDVFGESEETLDSNASRNPNGQPYENGLKNGDEQASLPSKAKKNVKESSSSSDAQPGTSTVNNGQVSTTRSSTDASSHVRTPVASSPSTSRSNTPADSTTSSIQSFPSSADPSTDFTGGHLTAIATGIEQKPISDGQLHRYVNEISVAIHGSPSASAEAESDAKSFFTDSDIELVAAQEDQKEGNPVHQVNLHLVKAKSADSVETTAKLGHKMTVKSEAMQGDVTSNAKLQQPPYENHDFSVSSDASGASVSQEMTNKKVNRHLITDVPGNFSSKAASPGIKRRQNENNSASSVINKVRLFSELENSNKPPVSSKPPIPSKPPVKDKVKHSNNSVIFPKKKVVSNEIKPEENCDSKIEKAGDSDPREAPVSAGVRKFPQSRSINVGLSENSTEKPTPSLMSKSHDSFPSVKAESLDPGGRSSPVFRGSVSAMVKGFEQMSIKRPPPVSAKPSSSIGKLQKQQE